MELLGHKQLVLDIKKEITNSAGGQSFLFSGPTSIGKFQAAVQLANILVEEPDFKASENAPFPADVFILEPSLVTKDKKTKQKGIPVEEVRDALQFLSRYPSKGKYRVLIIRDAHVLSVGAQNMILKTLEEPPVSAVIILTTHEPGTLLSTVLSRTLTKEFQEVSEDEMEKKYSEAWLNENNTPLFFRNFGRPGILEEAKRDPENFENQKELLQKLYTITRLSVQARMDLAEKLSLDTPQAITLLEWWILGLRDQAQNAQKREMQIQLYTFIKSILEVIYSLKNTQANARLLIEQLFFQIR